MAVSHQGADAPGSPTERDLLFGLLALQLDFLDRDALLAGLGAWSLDGAAPLGSVLQRQGRLSADRLRLLDALTEEHLRAHGGDPQRSLAALPAVRWPADALRTVPDPALRAGLARVVLAAADGPRRPAPAARRRRAGWLTPLLLGAAAVALTASVCLSYTVKAVEREREQAEAQRQKVEGAVEVEAANLEGEVVFRKQTRQVLNTLTDELLGRFLDRQAPLGEPDRNLLRTLLAFYRRCAAARPDGPEDRESVADGTFRAGQVQRRLGQEREAEASLRAALPLLEGLTAEFPHDAGHRRTLARVEGTLGELLGSTGRPAEAEAAYRKALPLFERLAAEFPRGAGIRGGLARTHDHLARLLGETGRLAEAEEHDRAALALREKLAAGRAAPPRYRSDLAASHGSLGALLYAAGRAREAEASLRTALKLQQQLAADFPNVPAYQCDLAKGHNDLGALLGATGRVREAEAPLRAALAIQQRLAADAPGAPEYRRDLATTYHNLAQLLRDADRRRDAEDACRKALALRRQLAAESPGVPGYRGEEAQSRLGLALLLRAAGRRAEAEEACCVAAGLAEKLMAGAPDNPGHRGLFAGSLAALARLRGDAGDREAARRLLEEARAHQQRAFEANPHHPSYRAGLVEVARAYIGLAEHTRAAATAEGVARRDEASAADVYDAACCLSLCVPLAAEDARLAEGARAGLARDYGGRAVALLRRAVERGYRDGAHLRKDGDLDPLRGRDDFRALLRGLGGDGPPR
jgi:tetratricopeptide (TPR) repeat protein